MVEFDELKDYLPYYLSDKSLDKLFEQIDEMVKKGFNNEVYTTKLKSEKYIFQGDGLDKMSIVNMPDNELIPTRVIVLSNSCDINPENERIYSSNICYAPIIRLNSYIQLLKEEHCAEGKINTFLEKVRKQRYTSILYLPKHSYGLDDEGIVFLDKINNYPVEKLEYDDINKNKVFSLNNFGFYMFLLKLSIHFTRIREQIDRDNGNIIN
jgi:hypothetical protein